MPTNLKTHEHSIKNTRATAPGRSTSLHSEAQRWQTLLSHTPTQLRLARSLARTTRTRNETETNFPIGGLLRRLIPLNLRYTDKTTRCVIRSLSGRGLWLGGKSNHSINQSANQSITQSIHQLNKQSVEIICWYHLLSLSVKTISWDQLLRFVVEINCWDYLLRLSAKILSFVISCWDYMWSLAEIICWDCLLRLFDVISC